MARRGPAPRHGFGPDSSRSPPIPDRGPSVSGGDPIVPKARRSCRIALPRRATTPHSDAASWTWWDNWSRSSARGPPPPASIPTIRWNAISAWALSSRSSCSAASRGPRASGCRTRCSARSTPPPSWCGRCSRPSRGPRRRRGREPRPRRGRGSGRRPPPPTPPRPWSTCSSGTRRRRRIGRTSTCERTTARSGPSPTRGCGAARPRWPARCGPAASASATRWRSCCGPRRRSSPPSSGRCSRGRCRSRCTRRSARTGSPITPRARGASCRTRAPACSSPSPPSNAWRGSCEGRSRRCRG